MCPFRTQKFGMQCGLFCLLGLVLVFCCWTKCSREQVRILGFGSKNISNFVSVADSLQQTDKETDKQSVFLLLVFSGLLVDLWVKRVSEAVIKIHLVVFDLFCFLFLFLCKNETKTTTMNSSSNRRETQGQIFLPQPLHGPCHRHPLVSKS